MKVGFCGLGKLGFPCALAIAMKGHDVYGYDINPDVMNTDPRIYKEAGIDGTGDLNDYLGDNFHNYITSGNGPGGKLFFSDLETIGKKCEIIFMAIQTPHQPQFEGTTCIPEGRADFNYDALEQAVIDLTKHIDKKTAVVIISTVLPGTIRNRIMPHLNDHVKLCYNPFFIAMGTTMRDFLDPEFTLFGVNDWWSANMAKILYQSIHNAPFYECTIEEAELIKVSYNCYSDDTEVMTNEGWKFFADLTGDEEILSLNPETHEAEWSGHLPVPPNGSYTELIHFSSKKDDILVTPGHNMFAATITKAPTGLPCDGDTYGYKFSLVPAEELEKRSTFSFTRTARWVGENLDYVTICSNEIPSELYATFMGWYLAEGCVSQISKDSWQIVISQSKRTNPEKWTQVIGVVEQITKILGVGYCSGDMNVVFYHKHFGMYLSQFGNVFSKYVPTLIKEASFNVIQCFLDAYLLGDGHQTPDGSTTYYASSSRKMADDLGELIVKIGHMPSYRQTSNEWSTRDCFLVYETTSKTSTKRNVERVPYNGNVWCTRLDKNHVMLTRRNGRCTWQGNTFIGMKIVFANTLMEICYETENCNVDCVTDALKLSNRRLISTAYLSGGMGDGGGCLPAGELIYTAKGATSIENIETNDLVLSGEGRLREVLETYKRPYKGNLCKVSVRGLPSAWYTPEHPVCVARDLRKVYETGGKTKRVTVTPAPEMVGPIEDIPVGELTDDYYIVFPIIEPCVEIPEDITLEYIELAGYYLSEGCYGIHKGYPYVDFCFNIGEISYAKEVERLAKVIDPTSKVTHQERVNKNTRLVRLRGSWIAEKLLEDFGRYSDGKYLASWVLFGDIDATKIILKGMFRGDGSSTSEGFSLSTTSSSIAYGANILLKRLGLGCTVQYYSSRERGDGILRKECWEVRVRNASYLDTLSELVGMSISHQMQDKRYNNVIFFKDGYYYHKVQFVERKEFEGTVYNFNVEEDHRYVTSVGVSQNCHPRDNIAMSWLAGERGLSHNIFDDLMATREDQARWLCELVSDEFDCMNCSSYNDFDTVNKKPILILGTSFKPESNIEVGSPALLCKNILEEEYGHTVVTYDPFVNDHGFGWSGNAKDEVILIGTKHECFSNWVFPPGSIVIDPFRYIPDQENVKVIRVGE